SGLVPFFPVFAPAAHVRRRIDESALQERQPERAEVWSGGDVEAAVTGQQRGVGAVQLQAFPVNQKHRYTSAVLADTEHLLRIKIVCAVTGNLRLPEDNRGVRCHI